MFQSDEIVVAASYANQPPANAVNLIMKELRFWSILRFETELQKFAYK